MKHIITLIALILLSSCSSEKELPTRTNYSAICEGKDFGTVKYARIDREGTYVKIKDGVSYTYSPSIRCVVIRVEEALR